MLRLRHLLPLTLAACGVDATRGAQLWDPTAVVSADGAVYAPLTRAGDVVVLREGDDPVLLAPEAGRFEGLIASPDGRTVLARLVTEVCPASAAYRQHHEVRCGLETRVRDELQVLAPAGLPVDTFAAGSWYDRFLFSDDGRYVVALLDPSASTAGGGIVNLQAVLVIDLQAGRSWEVSVGFQASRVLFLTEGAAATKLVVLSQNEVALVDLTGAVPVPSTVYPLTLSADVTVAPIGVATTPDQRYALITVAGAADLYVLDLQDPSINLVSLAAPPAAMAVDAAHDQTVFVYASKAVAEVVDHRLFDVRAVTLAAPATSVWMGDDHAVLANTGGSVAHVSRLDTADLSVADYKLNWAAQRLAVAPDGGMAVALSAQGSEGRLEVLDLVADDRGHYDVRPKPFGLSGPPADVAFRSDASGTTVLLLQSGVETLFQLGWPSLQVATVDLPDAPVGIGTVGTDAFYVTYDDPLGRVSFWHPDGTLTSVDGFATFDLLAGDRIAVEEAP